MRADEIGNCREEKAARARAWRAKKRREREDRDEDHLAMIQLLPCTVCERSPPRHVIHAHHLRHGSRRGIGQKPSDYESIPLCCEHRDEVHRCESREEQEWFQERGYASILATAEAYKHQRGDHGRLIRVSLAHKLSASRLLQDRT